MGVSNALLRLPLKGLNFLQQQYSCSRQELYCIDDKSEGVAGSFTPCLASKEPEILQHFRIVVARFQFFKSGIIHE